MPPIPPPKRSANEPLAAKVAHVKAAKQERGHTCHWPGCGKRVPPAMWGCYSCWRKIPKYLQKRLWDAYRPGQETDMTPSNEYLDAAQAIQDWIRENYGG